MFDDPLEPRDRARNERRQVSPENGAKNLDPRVSSTTPSRWTITPLFYSRSTDLTVLRGNGPSAALERPQTREL